MGRATRTAALVIAASLLSGCGTTANLSSGVREGWKSTRVYGGVRRDIESAQQWIGTNWTPPENPDYFQDIGTIVGVGLIGIDVPVSAIADTLTLPITIPASIWGGSANGSPAVSNKQPAVNNPQPAVNNPRPAVGAPRLPDNSLAPPSVPQPPASSSSRSASESGR